MDFSTFLEQTNSYRTIPLEKVFFADTLTPIQVFRKLQDEAVYLLESNDPQSRWSNYSFIGLNPFAALYEEHGSYRLFDETQKMIFEEKTFSQALKRAMRYFQPKPSETPVPFYGGAVGYVSYEAVQQIENVPAHPAARPEDRRFSFLFCRTIVAISHREHHVHIFSHAVLNGNESEREKKEIYDKAISEMNRVVKRIYRFSVQEEPKKIGGAATANHIDFSTVRSNYTKEKFIRDVQKIKNYIARGDIFQAVLSQRFSRPVRANGLDIYRVLRVMNPSPYMFYMRLDGMEIVGSSPERLVEVKEGQIEIHPIAGTRKRGDTVEEDQALAQDLLHDKKEQAEHVMLVDLARNDIGRTAAYGTVETSTFMEVGYFSHVIHLISRVRGRLKDGTEPVESFLAAFPAGTVSGAPKVRAMEIIAELEPTARHVYAGAIGYFGFDGNIDSCIAIRTLIIRNGTAYVQAGAGIVSDSVPENEWEETKNKARALLAAIAVAEERFARRKEEHYV